VTVRLVGLARREWASFDGSIVEDPLLLPPDRFLNRVYWWAIKNASEQSQIDKFDRKLWRPPRGKRAAPGSPWSPEAETQAFASLAAQVGQSDAALAAMREGQAPPTPT
jgi:hypothetical protein